MNKKENPNGISSPRALEKKSTRARVVKCVKVHEYENIRTQKERAAKKSTSKTKDICQHY
jgi:hypothetical protein